MSLIYPGIIRVFFDDVYECVCVEIGTYRCAMFGNVPFDPPITRFPRFASVFKQCSIESRVNIKAKIFDSGQLLSTRLVQVCLILS